MDGHIYLNVAIHTSVHIKKMWIAAFASYIIATCYKVCKFSCSPTTIQMDVLCYEGGHPDNDQVHGPWPLYRQHPCQLDQPSMGVVSWGCQGSGRGQGEMGAGLGVIPHASTILWDFRGGQCYQFSALWWCVLCDWVWYSRGWGVPQHDPRGVRGKSSFAGTEY